MILATSRKKVVSRWNLTLQNGSLLLDTTAEEWILSGESDLTPHEKTITRAVLFDTFMNLVAPLPSNSGT